MLTHKLIEGMEIIFLSYELLNRIRTFSKNINIKTYSLTFSISKIKNQSKIKRGWLI